MDQAILSRERTIEGVNAPPVPPARGDSGLAVIEWILLIFAIIVPMAAVIFQIMESLERYYSISGWVVALPFP